MQGVLAAILESADPERLYTGLSLLVSSDDARAIATFGALGALLDPDLEQRAKAQATHVIGAELDAFARTLTELRALAAPRIWACAAAVQATGLEPTGLAGVSSIPSFLRDAEGAQIVVV